MLFDFPAFIEELREKEDKKEIVEKYEKHFWKIQWDIKDQIWYTDYLSKFPTQAYLTPEDLDDEPYKEYYLNNFRDLSEIKRYFNKYIYRNTNEPKPFKVCLTFGLIELDIKNYLKN